VIGVIPINCGNEKLFHLKRVDFSASPDPILLPGFSRLWARRKSSKKDMALSFHTNAIHLNFGRMFFNEL
jgi:hypothetical protein